VVIGGQAVAFWADVYRNDLPPALRPRPLTSKDLDFAGDKAAVRLAADRLGGQALLATMDDATPNVGVVSFIDESGTRRAIDFLEVPFGIASAETVIRRAQQLEVLTKDGEGTGQVFLVLHPVHTLQSRVANVAALPGGDRPQGLDQLRASIACCRGFTRTVLSNFGQRPALKLNEEAFRIARSMHGRRVLERHGIDPFEAVLVDERLPEKFRSRRYPQMREQLHAVRSNFLRQP
jgi:hypothetical protein